MKKINIIAPCFALSILFFSLQASDKNSNKNPLNPKCPHNFSMLPKRPLGGMACPKKPEHIKYLQKQGVKLIVSLTQEPLSPDLFVYCPSMKNVHIPIANHRAPTFEDAALFLQEIKPEIDQGNHVIVHCQHGKGRTGTMLATWLIYDESMNAKQAIKITDRRLHKEQKKFLSTFYEKQIENK